MRPPVLTLENFRCFRKPQRLELRPLTILYGQNNAGKSAALRSLALISDSFGYEGLDALNLRGRVAEWQWGFSTLRHYGLSNEDDPTIGITLSAGDTQCSWRLKAVPDWGRVVIDRLEIVKDGQTRTWEHQLVREDARRDVLHYRSDDGEVSRLAFRGLSAPTELDCPMTLAVQWLKAAREVPRRDTLWEQSSRRELRPDASDAPTLLADDPEIFASVSRWFERSARLSLRVTEDSPRRVSTRVKPVAPGVGFEVDLIDSGEGLGQALGVITALQLLRHRREGEGPDVVALEEPELHLHKDLQRALLDEAVDVARLRKGSIVLETHAPTLLYATQLALADGRLSPEDVALYWVSRDDTGASTLRPVAVDREGWLAGDWPPGALREDLAIQSALQDRWDAQDGMAE